MPGQRFASHAERFVEALEMAGATVLVTSSPQKRPLKIRVMVGDRTYSLEVYLWTITHGGKGRNRPREFRIQRTAPATFELRAGVRTIMGGWHEETSTFAFWDVRRHLTKGKSTSSQISLDTLEGASLRGLATEHRQLSNSNEVAVAVQQDYLLWYVEEYGRIYDVSGEVADAGALVDAKQEEQRHFVDSAADPREASRRHTLVEIVRGFRDARFRPQVLRAYNFRCCLTGIALRIVDAAHIIPVADPRSTDEVRNGVALNPLLHRAYDAGLLGLLPGGRAALNQRFISSLRKQRVDAGLHLLEGMIPATMTLPGSQEFVPPDEYLYRGLKARGWTDDEIAVAGGS